MYKLISLYEQRLKGVPLDTVEDLEYLLKHDEKKLYFALMYFYLTQQNLGGTLCMSPAVSAAVSLFCESCCDACITMYFSRYFSLSEIPEQIGKIYNELAMFSQREQIIQKLQ